MGLTVATGEFSVGAADGTGKGATVGSCTGSVVGDTVVEFPAVIDGTLETRGPSVGNCARGASLQISLPPITERGAISEHCLAF